MNKEGKKIKKLYDNYLALRSVIEETAFLTEDGILVQLDLVRVDRNSKQEKEESTYGR